MRGINRDFSMRGLTPGPVRHRDWRRGVAEDDF